MTTPVQQKIRDKKRTPEQIADMVKSGDWINHGSVGGDSTVCTKAVAKRLGPGPGQLRDIEFWMYASFIPIRNSSRSIPAGISLRPRVLLLPLEPQGPGHQQRDRLGPVGLGLRHVGATITASSTPSRKSAASTGGSTPHGPRRARLLQHVLRHEQLQHLLTRRAKKIVFEVRSDYPWAEGGRFNTIHIDDIDYWVEVDCEKYKWPQINEKAIKSKPEEEAIAQHVMTIMRDRDIVQLGIGSLPSACVAAMADAGFKDLGIHTEMLNYGLIKLIESGQVTNAYKTRSIAARASGPLPFPSMCSGTTTRSTGTSTWPSMTSATRTTSRT